MFVQGVSTVILSWSIANCRAILWSKHIISTVPSRILSFSFYILVMHQLYLSERHYVTVPKMNITVQNSRPAKNLQNIHPVL